VLQAGIRKNGVTGQEFHHALVKTLGGTLDVVADKMQVQGELRSGNIVQGEFWLCGRLIEGQQNGHGVS
jgi:hypothetical protein